MSDADDGMLLDDHEPVTSRNKGKGKAVEGTDIEDTLPWYIC
jgi:hypothetical protein